MDVLVAATRAERRWALADALDVPAPAATSPAEAVARLAHPVGSTTAAVVLVVATAQDAAHVAPLARRAPVVAVADDGLTAAAVVGGAAAVVSGDAPLATVSRAVSSALLDVVVGDVGGGLVRA